MRHFNLLEESWIPVRLLDGSRGEVGIRDALLGAASIATIEDPSPLVVASLHRLLLAVLYRALSGPTDIEQAKDLFRDGLPLNRIEAYLDKWRDRFWLFDDRFPFYQVPDYQPKEEKGEKQWKSWTVLAMEHNGDNSKVLMDHIATANAGEIRTPQAARWLVACQTFTPGGGNSDFKYTRGGPAANAVVAIPVGHTLEETLIFCLVPENREILANDFPLWEREPDSLAWLREGPERAATGWSDLYTWRSRSIRLRYDGDDKGVSGLAFASGVGLAGELIDPMMGYRIAEKHGRLVVQFQERGLWRDFDSMLPNDTSLAPLVVAHAATITESFRERGIRSVIVLGQATDQAKIKYWRMERFALSGGVATDHFVQTEILARLAEAESAASALEGSLRELAKLSLARTGRALQEDKWSAGKWRPGDVSKFLGKRTPEGSPTAAAGYWSALEIHFHDMLQEYSSERDSEHIHRQWLWVVWENLNLAWIRHCKALATSSAWTMRALVKAEGPVRRKLRALKEEIHSLTPQMEDA